MIFKLSEKTNTVILAKINGHFPFLKSSKMFLFLGLALTYILENSFKPEAGARPGVSKIGILITDGKSQDDVIPPAKNLRDAGIELFAIGVYSAMSMCCVLLNPDIFVFVALYIKKEVFYVCIQ